MKMEVKRKEEMQCGYIGQHGYKKRKKFLEVGGEEREGGMRLVSEGKATNSGYIFIVGEI